MTSSELADQVAAALGLPVGKPTLHRLLQLENDVMLELRSAEQKLAQRKAQMLYPKDKGQTDLDREVRLAADVASEQREYGLWRDRQDMLQRRIEICKLFFNPESSQDNH